MRNRHVFLNQNLKKCPVPKKGRDPPGLRPHNKIHNLAYENSTSEESRNYEDEDGGISHCECDAGMITAAPSKEEFRNVVPQLRLGVKVEFYWEPLDMWFEGKITNRRKNG